jgi:hypothetical protein
MNNDLLLIGIICLVGGVMGYMYVSDQADNYYINTLFSGNSHSLDYSTYKMGSYLLAGLSVLGGVLCAAGIFSSPSPRSEPKKIDTEEAKPSQKPDAATKKQLRLQSLKYGVVLLVGGVAGSVLLPGYIGYVCQVIAVTGFMLIASTLII